MRYFIHLGFDGTDYSGWQRQKDTSNTVQEIIEKTLFQLFKKEISVYGCGRTDAGVHASQYVIQIHLDTPPLFNLKFRLNKNLPDDIAVFEVLPVSPDQHCRYDASARTYDYFLHWEKDPGLMRYSSFYDDIALDFDAMKKAVALIGQTTNFTALCKQPDLYTNHACHVHQCALYVNQEAGRLRFSITANRFLRGMIRICVFYLLQVGTGKLTVDEFGEILRLEKTVKQVKPALPNGLFLSKIEYPYLQLKNTHSIIKMLKMGLD